MATKTILISANTYFQSGLVIREKECYCTVINGSNYQETILNINVYALNTGYVIFKADINKTAWRDSLVAQWLRICLPIQGTWARALVWEGPTCRGATRPVSHNY